MPRLCKFYPGICLTTEEKAKRIKDKEKKTNVLGKNRSREYSKGNKTVPGKVATTHTEDGHKQDT